MDTHGGSSGDDSPSFGSEVEAVPGIWDGYNTEGMICVINQGEFDVTLEPGKRVAEVVEAVLQTDVCQDCGQRDTRAWFPSDKDATCDTCGAYTTKTPAPCLSCGAGGRDSLVLSYQGCSDCRPEAVMKGKVRAGPASSFLAGTYLDYVHQNNEQTSCSGGRPGDDVTYAHHVAHIVEEPG